MVYFRSFFFRSCLYLLSESNFTYYKKSKIVQNKIFHDVGRRMFCKSSKSLKNSDFLTNGSPQLPCLMPNTVFMAHFHVASMLYLRAGSPGGEARVSLFPAVAEALFLVVQQLIVAVTSLGPSSLYQQRTGMKYWDLSQVEESIDIEI